MFPEFVPGPSEMVASAELARLRAIEAAAREVYSFVGSRWPSWALDVVAMLKPALEVSP